MLSGWADIGLLLALGILFVAFTLATPFVLSGPARWERFLKQLRQDHPNLARLVPGFKPPPAAQVVPYNPNRVKGATFECGMETVGSARVQFNFRYYFFALIFVALDVVVVFLFPWAVALRGLGLFGLIAAGVFVLLVFVGYLYAWKKKVLEWK